MRTRTFSEEEKTEIKKKMIEAGIPLLKENGMIHMSITKLTEAAGIGKSTFYSFYSSKEEFVEDMLDYHRKSILAMIKDGLNGKMKYSAEESKNIIRTMIFRAENMYRSFSGEDEVVLKKMYDRKGVPYLDLAKERQVIDYITSMMEGVRAALDYAVIANLMKMIVLSSEQRELLHESGYVRSIEKIVDLLLEEIFEM